MTPPPKLPELPRLRPGCRFSLHEFRDGTSWVLEDPTSGKFFRVGLREERLARRLDGRHNVLELMKPSEEGGEELSGQEVLQFLQTLHRAGLLDNGLSLPGEAAPEAPKPRKPFNPLYLRVPLGNPNRPLGWIAGGLRRLPLRLLFLLVLALYAVGAYTLLAHLDQVWSSAGSVFSIANAPAFFLSFLVLKLLHEMGHGVACRYFGGRVPQAGLYFILFMPLTYIDATDVWRFPSRRVRSLVTMAGMLVEFAVAAVAVLVWHHTEPGAVHTVALNVIITATVTTVLFNANPLMRFDGYFLLSDWLGIPNLYQLAGKAGRAFLLRLFLGVRPPQRYGAWLTCYGLGCMFWRLGITVSICIGAIVMLHGIGLALTLLTVVTMLIPLARGAGKLLGDIRSGQIRVAPVRVAVLAAAVAVLFLVPLEGAPSCYGVIEPARLTPIRVQCPGFVEEIAVRPGEKVAPGQLLARLDNREEAIRVATLENSARRAEAVANTLRDADQLRQASEQRERAAGLRKRAAEAAAHIETLALRAPDEGVVFAGRLDDLPGIWLRPGRELMLVGSASEREARIVVSQELYHRIRPQAGQKIRLLIPGRFETVEATLTTVESAGTRVIRHESLTALAGGPLNVIRSEGQGEGMQLVDPHFYLTARIEHPGTLHLGERCLASFPDAERRTLVEAAIGRIRHYLRTSEEKAEGRPQPS